MKGKGVSILYRAALAMFAIAVSVTSAAATIQETVLHSFNPNPDGITPASRLISDAAGNYYGTTSGGGAYDLGTVFELSPRSGGGWTQKVLYSFKYNGSDGANPYASLIFDSHGNLYGTTAHGGTFGSGTVFELRPHGSSWSETVLHSFNPNSSDGAYPYAGLIFDAGGNLYGTTAYGGTYNNGTVFKLTPHGSSWTETVMHSFNSNGGDGAIPYAGLMFDAHGNLWGTTSGGGSYSCGTVFELTPHGSSWTAAVMHSFNSNGTDGAYPYAGLISDAHGNLYGTTEYGGTYECGYAGCGTVFELSPHGSGWTETVLHSFDPNGSDGINPIAGLILDAHGNLYGTLQDGGTYGYGTAFELTPGNGGEWIETVLYSFTWANGDGAVPYAGLTFDSAGNLYGTTIAGGAYGQYYGGYGSVFELSPEQGGGWTEAVLYSFNLSGADGAEPLAGVIFDSAGNLYGTTYGSGADGYGTVFELSPGHDGWTETVLHSFNRNGTDGTYPSAGLVFDHAGNLYGTTRYGGANHDGTVYELSPGHGGEWAETVLHTFGYGTDGIDLFAGLVFDHAGNLYGTAMNGGTYTYGTVFELSPEHDGTWAETELYGFNTPPNGRHPRAGLISDSHGNLYGTTFNGGIYEGNGTVFELSPNGSGEWTETVLHSFGNGTDGSNPQAALIFDAHGNLYGTTTNGGTYASGTVFKLSPGNGGGWTETVLHSFGNGTDGSNPQGGLIFDAHGNLYGTAINGGTYMYGTVFELSPGNGGEWTETTLHNFGNGTDGVNPQAGLIFDAHGNLYGATSAGGAYNYGTVFEIEP